MEEHKLTEQDWKNAEAHLANMERAAAEIGSLRGMMFYLGVLAAARVLYDSGDRSVMLYETILGLS